MKFIENKKFKIILILIICLSNYIYSVTIQNSKNFMSTNSKTYMTLQNSLLSTPEIKVENIIKKSPKISTEGLFYENGQIFESGYFKNKSFIMKKNYNNKKIIKTVPLLSLSGKGISKCGQKFYQVTEKEKKVISFTYPDLDLISSNPLDSEIKKGGGLASLGQNNMLATDGSNNLHILDCTSDLYVLKSIPVTDSEGNEMNGLQDLTVVGEFVYANRLNDNRIFKIDPHTGKVLKTYNLINLINYELKMKSINRNDIAKGSVLNGITYDKNRNLFILTGRNWSFYYEVKLE